MHEAPARLRLDVACNDPDNGLFAGRAEQLEVETWDKHRIELDARGRAPSFTEVPRGIRLHRRVWPVLESKDWYGNWCWNAYWLAPDDLLGLLSFSHSTNLFHCTCAPSGLFENWNDGQAFNRDLWAASLWGRPGIGVVGG